MERLCKILFAAAVLLALWGCAVEYGPRDTSPGALFARAEKALREHRFNEALYLYSRLVDLYPGDRRADDALFKKGYLEVYFGKYSDAGRSFSALVSDYPESEWRFDASLWAGVLGELSACRGVEVESPGAASDDCTKLRRKLKRLEAENAELRRQLQKLREILEK